MSRQTRFDLIKMAASLAALLVPSVSTAQWIPPGSSCYVSPTTGQTVCYLPAAPAAAFSAPRFPTATPVTAFYPASAPAAVPVAVPVAIQPVIVPGNAPGPIEGFFRAIFQNPRPQPVPVAVAAPVVPATFAQPIPAPSFAAPAASIAPAATGVQAAYPPTTVYRVPTLDPYPQPFVSSPPTSQLPATAGAVVTSPPVSVQYRPVYGSAPQGVSGLAPAPSQAPPPTTLYTPGDPSTAPAPVEPPRAQLQYDDRGQGLPE